MTWVVFDYGGVICSPQPEQDVAAMAAVAGCAVPEFRRAYWACRVGYDLARFTAAEYWRSTLEHAGARWDAAAEARLTSLDIASWMHLQPGTVRLIGDLAAAGSRLAMLSNAPVPIADAVAALPVARHFEHLFFSCHLGAVKPDAPCFLAVIAALGADPADVIFTDDRAENIEGAARVGIRGILFTDADATRGRLIAP